MARTESARIGMAVILLLGACDRAAETPSEDLGVEADLATTPKPDLASACPRNLQAADRARKVVVSHPYTGRGGQKATAFEVLELSATGTLTRPNVTFQMGTAMWGAIQFTPDGEVGIVPQEDGSLGVFTFDTTGVPVVLHAAFMDGFYAREVVIDPSGQFAWVLDPNTDGNGGGIYRVDINCDGTLTGRGRVVPGGKGNVLALYPGEEFLRGVYATGPAGGNVHLLAFAGPPMIDASGDAFGDDDAIPSSATVMSDNKLALIADNGVLAGSRIAAVTLPGLQRTTVLTTPNPAAVIASPFGDAALVLNSDGMDALRVIAYEPQNTPPVRIKGEVTYTNGKPELPTVAVTITRGTLRGRVLIAENLAVRQVQFAAGATVTDVSKLSFGPGIANIVGTVGVQP